MSLNCLSFFDLKQLFEDKNNELLLTYNKYVSDKRYLSQIQIELQKKCVHKWIRDDSGCMYGDKISYCSICDKIKM